MENSTSTTESIIKTLISNGCHRWTQYGKDRIYISKAYFIEITSLEPYRSKAGNARQEYELDGLNLYYDIPTDKFYWNKPDNRKHEYKYIDPEKFVKWFYETIEETTK